MKYLLPPVEEEERCFFVWFGEGKMSRKFGGKAGGGRSKVGCVKPADPPFIQRIKEQIGWKAGPTIESKVSAFGTLICPLLT